MRHQHDAVTHGLRVVLVVGDIDEGRAEPLVDVLELLARRRSQVRVEVADRLVEQEDLGAADDRAAEGDPLTLAAAQRAGLPVQEAPDAEHLGHLFDLPVALLAAEAPQHQREGDVVPRVHVRIERVGLEHHGDVPALRGDVGDVRAIHEDPAGRHLLDPCQQFEDRALARSGRPEDAGEQPVLERQRRLLHGVGRQARVALDDAIEPDLSHPPLPWPRPAPPAA